MTYNKQILFSFLSFYVLYLYFFSEDVNFNTLVNSCTIRSSYTVLILTISFDQ